MQHKNKQKMGKSAQRRVYLLIVAAILTLLFAACGSSSGSDPIAPTPTHVVTTQIMPGDWPTYAWNNGRSGFNSDETLITPRTALHLSQHWIYHAKSRISAQPVKAFGMVYWGDWDGFEHATDLDGREVWATNLGKTHLCQATIGVADTATAASVSIGGTPTAVIFVGGGDAHFYALSALTGKVLWKTQLGTTPAHFLWSSPILYHGSVYIGMASLGDCPAVQGQLIQMNAATGAIQHIFNVVPDGCIGGGVWGSPTIDVETGELYFATGSPDDCWTTEDYVTSVIELHAADLTFVDSWQVPPSEWVIDSDFGTTPTLFTATIGGTIRPLLGVSHKNGTYYTFIRGAIGQGPVWSVSIAKGGSCPACGEGSISTSAWDGTRLYVAGGKTVINGTNCAGSVRALKPATGEFLWELCLTGGPVLAPVTAVPGVVVVESGPVFTLIDATSGKTLFTYKDTHPNSAFNGGSAISDGILYLGNFDGSLYAFGL